jgi:RNA polymerase sigma factor for flagellar operon FliA
MKAQPEQILANRDLWEAYWRSPDSSEAMNSLMDAFLPLVSRVLKRLLMRMPSGVAVEDVYQAGMIGLYQAIERFREDAGAAFETFAQKRIRGAVVDELRRSDNLSRSARQRARRIQEEIQDWTDKHGAPPTDDEIAARLGMEADDVSAIAVSVQPWLSFDSMVLDVNGKEVCLKDLLGDSAAAMPDKQAQKSEALDRVRAVFRKLSSREQKIMYLYYYEDLRLGEIADIFEVSEARICQIHALALFRLRALLAASGWNSRDDWPDSR